MKRKLYFFAAVCAAFIFASCGDQTVSFDDQWKLDNEAQFARIAANPEYTKLESKSNEGYIMYKKIASGTGEKPFFTDEVKVLYTGWYKNEWGKGDTYTGEHGNIITNKKIFDSTANRNNIPSPMVVSRMVDGFRTALQEMQVGDKWEIWIPWNLAYGARGSNNIRGYTTLVFEIELIEIL